MRALLAFILLLCAPLAIASDLVLKNKETGSELRLMDSQCSHGETLGVLQEQWRAKFKNARILNRKGFIEFYGCWIQHDAETIFILLQDGASIALPAAAFNDPSV